jgi:hypothetical protein
MPIDHEILRQRIRDRISEEQNLTMRNVSIAAFGSDSALHKFLTGANKSIKLDNLSSVADALGTPLSSLLFGEPARPALSAAELRAMVDDALSEMQPGMSIAEIRPAVASNLREQLERVLSGQAALGQTVPANPPDTAALSDAPTKRAGRAKLHMT